MKIYVASSWRNPFYPTVLAALIQAGHEVYDFKNEEAAFNWDETVPPPTAPKKAWSPERTFAALRHPLADRGFDADFKALREADVCVLCLPAGSSAHLEAGFAAGQGKPVVVYVDHGVSALEPELMWKILGAPIRSLDELVIAVARRSLLTHW